MNETECYGTVLYVYTHIKFVLYSHSVKKNCPHMISVTMDN